MKSLEKDRRRRYETANDFAADVMRYLTDQPVEACTPSASYRFQKFARRNKAVLTTAALVVAALCIGAVVSTWQAVRATRAEVHADSQRELAEASAKEAQRQTTEPRKAQGDALRAKQDAERQRIAVSQNLYFADLRLGLVDWTVGNVARLSDKLLSHVPRSGGDDLRGWEWYYLLSLCHQDQRTLMHHAKRVEWVAWSPDGRYLASTSYGGTLVVYDTTAWRPVQTHSRSTPQGVCWSPDSQRVAWGEGHSGIHALNGPYVMEIQSGVIRTVFGHTNDTVETTAWSPDGRYLASGALDGGVRLWDGTSGQYVKVMGRTRSMWLSWHPEGRLLASMGWEGLQIWESPSGKMVQTIPSTEGCTCAAWSPDGTRLALATWAGKCQVYRTADWSIASKWDAHRGPVNAVAWRPDGSRLVSGGADNLIQHWDPASGACTQTLRGHLNQVQSLAWEPNGRRLVSGGGDGLIKVWAISADSQPRRLNGNPGVSFAWCQESDTLRSLSATDGTVALWNVVNGRRLAEVKVARGRHGRLSSGGKFVAIAETGAKEPHIPIHDARSGETTQTLKYGSVAAVHSAFSPDASKLAVTDGSALEVLDLHQKRLRSRRENIRVIHELSWSPDGRLLAVAGAGDTRRGSSYYVSWVHVFESEKPKPVLSLRHGESDVQASAVTWSPNGQRLASGDQNGLAEVWDLPSGKRVMAAHMHTSEITALAWSPDNRRVASGGDDSTVRVWDPNRGEELLTLDAQSKVTQIDWSPDGRRLAAATTDGSIRIWDASAGYEFVHSEDYDTEQVRRHLSEAAELWKTGRKDKALALYQQTVEERKARPSSVPVWATNSLRKLWSDAWSAREYRNAIRLYELAAQLSGDDAMMLNNMAWYLGTCPDPAFRDATKAVALAMKAAQLNPTDGAIRNTLGVAHFRAGDWKGAIEALMKAEELAPGKFLAFDGFFLALAHWQIADKEKVRKWFDQAVAWMKKNRPQDEELMRFRAEAEELLGIKAKQQ
jgi:WD40 repeat protein